MEASASQVHRSSIVGEQKRSAPNVVEVSRLKFWWTAAVPVIDIESLTVAAGERVFVRGPSGSGKSTLLSLLGGVLTPRAGSIRILGEELSAMSGAQRDRFRADHIGFIFQMFNLIPYLSVVENVSLPCGFSALRHKRAGEDVRGDVRRLLEELDMASDQVMKRSVSRLSVGQQQRVAAARALIGAPELVIADEPTSSLDADLRTAFVDLLFRECSRNAAALVFVSHDAALAPMFDRAIEFTRINRAGTSSAMASGS